MKPQILAFSLLFAALPGLAQNGTAYFSAPINWSNTGALYFTVSGGPASTCGDLSSTRNGSSLYAAGWICTDASGNATKGPWTWAGTPADQTDKGVKIYWPGGGSTNAVDHIWDKTCPTMTLTSGTGTPPSGFAGHSNDATWGAGFNTSWTQVGGYFWDMTLDSYWKPGYTAYSFPSTGYYIVFPPVTGWPAPGQTSLAINWSYASVPPPTAHVSGHHYRWVVGTSDGDRNCFPTIVLDFIAP